MNPMQATVGSKGITECAVCRKEKPFEQMKVCMDYRQMHIYVCSHECMINFYK